jgi:hypothetical protein
VRSAFLKERFRRTGSRIRTLEVCLFLSLACSCAAAFDSDRTIAQFAHTSWGPKDGAPSVVEALAQSADGYLWLGSPDGLYWAATESGLARLEGNRWREVGRDWNFPGEVRPRNFSGSSRNPLGFNRGHAGFSSIGRQ